MSPVAILRYLERQRTGAFIIIALKNILVRGQECVQAHYLRVLVQGG